MSGKVAGMVWELDIPLSHAWVLMSLADHAEHDGSQVFPGNRLTAWKTGYSVAYVKRILKDLRDEYELIELIVEGGGAQRAEYRICLEKFADYQKEPPKGRGAPQNNGHARKQTGEHQLPGNSSVPGNSQNKPGNSTRARGETSVETSYSRRDADASHGQEKTSDEGSPNWFDVYCLRTTDVGLPISNEDRKRIPGNLAKCVMKEGATKVEMNRLIGHLVQRRLSGVVLSPQEALKDIRGVRHTNGNGHKPKKLREKVVGPGIEHG